MGDFNDKVGDTSGEKHFRNTVGKYEICERYSRTDVMENNALLFITSDGRYISLF